MGHEIQRLMTHKIEYKEVQHSSRDGFHCQIMVTWLQIRPLLSCAFAVVQLTYSRGKKTESNGVQLNSADNLETVVTSRNEKHK